MGGKAAGLGCGWDQKLGFIQKQLMQSALKGTLLRRVLQLRLQGLRRGGLARHGQPLSHRNPHAQAMAHGYCARISATSFCMPSKGT